MWSFIVYTTLGYCSYKLICKFNNLRKQLEQTSNENKGIVNSSLAVVKFIKSLAYDIYCRKRYGLTKYYPNLYCNLAISFEIKPLQYTKVYIGSTIYYIPIIQKKGPQQSPMITKICTTGNSFASDDVTKMITPFLGPQNDFFGMNVKCNYFGFNNLTFFTDNLLYTFKSGEIIDLQKLIPLYGDNTEVISF